MEDYKKRLAGVLAETGALFFDKNLRLKDGRPTPYFVNMGMFRTGRLSMELGSFFAAMMVERGLVTRTDIILGPSYKGSAIALSTAIALFVNHGNDVLFDYDRKEEKAHGEGSKAASMLVNRTLFDGCRIFIVDDVATSMGTKYELVRLIEQESQKQGIKAGIIGIGIVIDREQTTAVYDEQGRVIRDRRGDNAIQSFMAAEHIPVYSVAGIREVIGYLYREQVPVMIEGRRMPMDADTKSQFDTYMDIYGVEDHGR